MEIITEDVPQQKKVLPIIFLLDSSGSMMNTVQNGGTRISMLNEGMRQAIKVMQEVENEQTEATLEIGAIQFDDTAKWVTNGGLIPIADFEWEDIEAGGLTCLGAALDELDEALSRRGAGLLTDPRGYKLPNIILLSDGEANDEWDEALKRISENNKWFKYAVRIAVGIGENYDRAVLTKFTGDIETVIIAEDVTKLSVLIRVLAATASKIGSQSRNSAGKSPAVTIVDTVNKETGDFVAVEPPTPKGDGTWDDVD